ncbi:hypothetical protein [Streptomyces sp. SAI-127]|uniref:hypothetical protein n=1 Tax=Streptomyces sp. SAI-127 TaxID=2940543 RepID=UPI002476E42C|nr:hypothetical protein [Streptomyces sp. SAI-127]
MSDTSARKSDTAPQRQPVALLDDQEPFDWGDLRASGDRADALLERIADDPQLLRTLLTRTAEDDTLLSMCERHRPFDKIVIYDGGDRNFRIRLHIWRTTEFERAHQHRFSFTSRLLQGHYRHVLYDSPRPARSEAARHHMDPEHPDSSSGLDLARIRPTLEYEMKAGDSYTLHHEAVHATLVHADTVSLILRGPAEKDVAFVANLDQGGLYWRFGRRDEDQTRIRAKQLTRDELTGCVADLRSRGLLG